MEDQRDMPHGRFRFRFAAALGVLGAATITGAILRWTYYDGGSTQAKSMFRATLARANATESKAAILTTNSYWQVMTNTIDGVLTITQERQFAPPLTNVWEQGSLFSAEWLHSLDALLLSTTDKCVDHYFAAGDSYDPWFARECYIADEVFLDSRYNLDYCALDDDWRWVWGGEKYDGEFVRVRAHGGVGVVPEYSTAKRKPFEIIESPKDFPMLIPAAVGLRAEIGHVRNIETNCFGQIIKGDFRFVKDDRDYRQDAGADNVTDWVLWQLTASKAPYIWSGVTYPFGHSGAGLLIPYHVDPFLNLHIEKMKPNSHWPEVAEKMRQVMNQGVYYCSYPTEPLKWTGMYDTGESFAVIGKREFFGVSYWTIVTHDYGLLGHFNLNVGDYLASTYPPALNGYPDPWRVDFVGCWMAPRGMTNTPSLSPPNMEGVAPEVVKKYYRPAESLGDTNAVWATYYPPDEGLPELPNGYWYANLIPTAYKATPATNEWYWHQWRGSSIPSLFVATNLLGRAHTNDYPVFRVVAGDVTFRDLPNLQGLAFGGNDTIDTDTGEQYLLLTAEEPAQGKARAHWQSVQGSHGWEVRPPTTNGIVQLAYAPAPLLFDEYEIEHHTRLTKTMIDERMAYADYLKHTVAGRWKWKDTKRLLFDDDGQIEIRTNRVRDLILDDGWEEDDLTDEFLRDLAQRLHQGLKKYYKDLDIYKPAILDDDDAYHVWPSEPPSSVRELKYNGEYHAAFNSPAPEEEFVDGLGNLDDIMSFFPLAGFAGCMGEQDTRGYTNLMIKTEPIHMFEQNNSYSLSFFGLNVFTNAIEINTSVAIATNDIDTSTATLAYLGVKHPVITNHYARTIYTAEGHEWVATLFSKRDEQRKKAELPDCLFGNEIEGPTNVLQELGGYLIGLGALHIYAFGQVTNEVGEVTEEDYYLIWDDRLPRCEWPDRARIVIDYENTYTIYTGWYTNNIASASTNTYINIQTEIKEPRPWTARIMYYDAVESKWVLIDEFNSYDDRSDDYGIDASIFDVPNATFPDGENYENVYFEAAFATNFSYLTCDGLPHGSTTERGHNGTINCTHGAEVVCNVELQAWLYDNWNAFTFERVISMQAGAAVTNYIPISLRVDHYGRNPYEADAGSTNIIFTINTWGGEWIEWDAFVPGKDDRLFESRFETKGAERWDNNRKATADWDALRPLYIWRFRDDDDFD